MGPDGGATWLARDGQVRTAWRVLLFILLFVALVSVIARVLGWLMELPGQGDPLLHVLLLQGVLLLAAGLLAGWTMLRWIDRRPLRELGFPLDRRALPHTAVGLLLGAAAVAVVVLLLALVGGFRYSPAPGSLAGWSVTMGAALLWLAIPAVAEETVFRGYLFRTLVEGTGPVAATLLMSTLFAAVHGVNPNLTAFGVFNIFLAGVMLSLAVLWTGSLWFASGLHLGWNWVMAGPLDLPVSGVVLFDVPLYDAAVWGPAWLTGGAFGPEGGLAGSAAAAAGVGLVWWYARSGRATGSPDSERDDHVQDR